MPPKLLYGGIDFDFDNPVFGIEEIREINPQRFEMEQLSGIVHVDRPSQRAENAWLVPPSVGVEGGLADRRKRVVVVRICQLSARTGRSC